MLSGSSGRRRRDFGVFGRCTHCGRQDPGRLQVAHGRHLLKLRLLPVSTEARLLAVRLMLPLPLELLLLLLLLSLCCICSAPTEEEVEQAADAASTQLSVVRAPGTLVVGGKFVLVERLAQTKAMLAIVRNQLSTSIISLNLLAIMN